MEAVIDSINDFFGNYLLISAMCAWFSAQIIKIFTGVFKNRKINLQILLFSTGGMPSSHSASVTALATSSALKYGFSSPYFAISAILAIIVMIDASGVRYETGKQATIINKIVDELFSGKKEDINLGLKELVGHTPFQVFVGAVLGVAIAVLLYFAV